MKEKVHHIKRHSKYSLSQFLPRLFTAFFIGFLLFSQNASGLSNVFEDLQFVDQDQNATLFHDANTPKDPLGNLPQPEKNPEESEENESKENLEDEFSDLHLHDLALNNFTNSIYLSKVINCEQSVQNRHTISLYILFHSWKSFLS